MRLEDLRVKDSMGAFLDFVEVEEAKRRDIIPEKFHTYIENNCKCGSAMIITTNRKRIMCCDPRCVIKTGYALAYMFEKFGIKGIGEKTCEKITRFAYPTLKHKSHLELFNLDNNQLSPEINGEVFITFSQAIRKIKQTPLTFGVMVSKIAIPSFESTAIKVLEGIDDFQQLLNQINKRGDVTNFLAMKGIRDPSKIFYFSEFLLDIAYAQTKIFSNLRSSGKIKINISATGNLNIDGMKITKAELVELANKIGEISPGVRLFEVEMNTAIQSNPYVIADYVSSSSKYIAAKQREYEEQKYNGADHKLVFTSKEFIMHLKEMVECAMENIPKKSQTN